jgi:hypothetical protein
MVSPPYVSYNTVNELKQLLDWWLNNQSSMVNAPPTSGYIIDNIEKRLSAVEEMTKQHEADLEGLLDG